MAHSSTVLLAVQLCRRACAGVNLNTPPKPKQAKAEELQEAEEQELEVDGSLEEET